MTTIFTHDMPAQRVVFGAGAIGKVTKETERLGIARALVVATPGSGQRLGQQVVAGLGTRAAALHAHAVTHVPRPVAEAGLAAAKAANADGLVAVGGGAAIGLAKAIALQTGLPILALPTTYAGSETTTIYGTSEGDRKFTGRDIKVLPKTILYDPDLTIGLPATVSAASGMNAIAHCVEALWISASTPVITAISTEAVRLFGEFLPRVVANGQDEEAREQCLIAAWLAGSALMAGTALHHKLAHVLGGLGLPHAETHAIILPHVTRFNLAQAPAVKARLAAAMSVADPAARLADMLRGFPIPQRLSEIGMPKDKIGFAAEEVGKLDVREPRPASVADVRGILEAAFERLGCDPGRITVPGKDDVQKCPLG